MHRCPVRAVWRLAGHCRCGAPARPPLPCDVRPARRSFSVPTSPVRSEREGRYSPAGFVWKGNRPAVHTPLDRRASVRCRSTHTHLLYFNRPPLLLSCVAQAIQRLGPIWSQFTVKMTSKTNLGHNKTRSKAKQNVLFIH